MVLFFRLASSSPQYPQRFRLVLCVRIDTGASGAGRRNDALAFYPTADSRCLTLEGPVLVFFIAQSSSHNMILSFPLLRSCFYLPFVMWNPVCM